MTRILIVNPQAPEPELIAEAAGVIRAGGLVAFPTETVYGLGANALNAEAVAGIFTAKDRPSQDPLIVHLASVADLPQVVGDISEIARRLAEAFWPGPLTIIMPRHDDLPRGVSAGLDTVAVRVPSHPVARALLQAAGVPIAAPSANRFGFTSPTSAQHVYADLNGRIEMILDGGSPTIGVESTVLDVSVQPARILRPGGVSREALEEMLGTVEVFDGAAAEAEQPLPSPGMMSRHYAPRTPMILFQGTNTQAVLWRMREEAATYVRQGQRVGLLAAQEDLPVFAGVELTVRTIGSEADALQIARHLYAGLRDLDEAGMDVILAHDFGEEGLGLAILDRLRRASSRVVKVTSGE
ncbi:MAG: L-threonylcarbamoyladenylate synthase [Anaerolineaceae bacterium]|nr:L-threonylcarbamoyladenylate synthase [Anaerolineaceae bacterium]